jgi:hypothetical protein
LRRVKDRRVAAAVAVLILAGTGMLLSRAFGSSPQVRPAARSSPPNLVRTICTGGEGAAKSCRSYFFPTHQLGPGDAVPKAGLEGDLIEQNGCILMDPAEFESDPFLLIWPPEYRLSGDGVVQILDGEGNVVGSPGDHRFAGGGETHYWSSEMPDDCLARHHWLVVDLTPSAPELERGGTAGGEVFFPSWGSAEGKDLPLAGVYGVLTERDGCLFLGAPEGAVLPLWEGSYSYRDGSLLDSSGRTVVRVGESLHGTGGYGSDWKWAEEIVGEAIPDRCRPDGAEPIALIYDVEPWP